MKLDLSTKQKKLSYIIDELKRLQGLEFINKDEVGAMNYACSILRNHAKKLDNTDTKIKEKKQHINNYTSCKGCKHDMVKEEQLHCCYCDNFHLYEHEESE